MRLQSARTFSVSFKSHVRKRLFCGAVLVSLQVLLGPPPAFAANSVPLLRSVRPGAVMPGGPALTLKIIELGVRMRLVSTASGNKSKSDACEASFHEPRNHR